MSQQSAELLVRIGENELDRRRIRLAGRVGEVAAANFFTSGCYYYYYVVAAAHQAVRQARERARRGGAVTDEVGEVGAMSAQVDGCSAVLRGAATRTGIRV